MYIKTLTIQGFKSYRDQTVVDPFSPKHNVVVGRNGSGKSNFFAAIRFVLSDAYTSMGHEERQSLLHEGASTSTTLSAYVEIVFDNSGNRFPTGRDEVILRRTIGVKKDDYSLDKKSANKADVMNLLESAGFSKSNPYYIVPQGRITALTNAKDHERLALLKEVAGTKVYEQRRAESLRIMSETDAKRNKIAELLEYIENRLTELEEEKEELKEFQEKDKERRCLEYAMYQTELEDITHALDEIEDSRRNELHNANERQDVYNNREKEIQGLERKITETRHALRDANLSKLSSQSELNDLIRSCTELECIVEDLTAAGERSSGRREELETELSNLNAEIAQTEAELAQLIPEWEQRKETELNEKRSLELAKGQLGALYSKQGRLSKFRTQGERDNYLRSEIASVEAFRQNQLAALQTAQQDLTSSRASLQDIEARIDNAETQAGNGKERVKELSVQIAALKNESAELTERRKELWREETKLTSQIGQASEELRSAERNLASMMDKDTGMGLKAVKNITDRQKLSGVYGPLYSLFEIPDDKFNTAIELTAGNSLWHVVVDTDETASRLLKIMNAEKTGRVTFMPLNRLRPKAAPPVNAQDAIPLLSKITYDPLHAKAFQQVFGKTCVCRDLTLAAAYVKSHGINTITLDGDKVDHRGALSGGYHDIRRSRLDGIRAVSTWRTKSEADESRHKEVKATILELDQQIARLAGQTQVLTSQLMQQKQARDGLGDTVGVLRNEKERVKERMEKLEGQVEDTEGELRESDTQIRSLRDELQTPMVRGLTDEEEAAIERLNREVDQRTTNLTQRTNEKLEVGGRKSLVEIRLNEDLKRRRAEVIGTIERLGEPQNADTAAAEDLDTRTRELQTLKNTIESLKAKSLDAEKEHDALGKQLQELRTALERMQSQQAEDNKAFSKQQKNDEKYHTKKMLLTNKKDDANRNIRDLGVLPEEAFGKYINEKLERLVKKLQKVNDGLKKFAHVNKKAFEQYNNFTKQRDQLIQRREDLDASAQSIQELVEVLDQRKDEAIERTFKQVAKNFEEVFEKLVPAGRGRLIIQRKIDQDEMEEDEETQQSSVDNYTGVAIKVSFNSKVDEGLRIQQLSGGQKSLVALATVFAIQKCDPAPFYLFDEIDANLDAQYRTAVAGMIHELSETAQFITTTFRPEMLVTADKFYGVLFDNQKVSSIRTIRREEAQEFVDQEAQVQ